MKSISLFSGAMGLDLGLLSAEINIAVGQDFDDSSMICLHTLSISEITNIL